MQVAEQETKQQAPRLKAPSFRDIQLAEHSYRRHDLTVHESINPKTDLENPSLWNNVAAHLRPGDEVRVMDEDMTWMAHVLITFVNGTDVRAKLLQGFDLAPQDGDEPAMQDRFKVKYNRSKKYWAVVRVEDGVEVIKEIGDKLTAQRELADYERALRN